jgi:hypothetical protein
MNNKFRRIWKEAVVAQFKLLPLNLSGGTDENHEIHQSGFSVSGPRFELGHPKYKAGVLTTRMRCLILLYLRSKFLRRIFFSDVINLCYFL